MTDWSAADIPPLNGRTAVITGATGGLGYETALTLAGAGAEVVVTGRNEAKGRQALQNIRNQFPNAKIAYEISIWQSYRRSPTSPRALPPRMARSIS
jgi:NAD(P)-dependent dehydrogenase (short-subunit alcohol dehydrogenase family)